MKRPRLLTQTEWKKVQECIDRGEHQRKARAEAGEHDYEYTGDVYRTLTNDRAGMGRELNVSSRSKRWLGQERKP